MWKFAATDFVILGMKDSNEITQCGRAAMWAAMIEGLREVCWEAGWVCAPHGSMANDLDLLMVPFGLDSESTQVLLDRINAMLKKVEPFACIVYVIDRPWHRKSYSVRLYGKAYLDISIIDVREPWDEESAGVLEKALQR